MVATKELVGLPPVHRTVLEWEAKPPAGLPLIQRTTVLAWQARPCTEKTSRRWLGGKKSLPTKVSRRDGPASQYEGTLDKVVVKSE